MSDGGHVPVMLGEVLGALRVRPGMVVVDCTVGLGGHSAEILKRVWGKGGRVIGMDMDAASLEVARKRLSLVAKEGKGFELFHSNFAGIEKVLLAAGAVGGVDGALADLGVSSPQIDDAARGFSYRQAGPLDMRMDRSRGKPAWELLKRMSEEEIAEALLELGDETDAPKIARLIVERRGEQAIETTEALTAIVCEARDFTLKRAAGAKLHPAARTFQALRMLVNREHFNLEHLLRVLPNILRPGGTAVMISFHSGEDRRVKGAFREGLRSDVYQAVSADAELASEEEVRENKRARSAKLRWARRAMTTTTPPT